MDKLLLEEISHSNVLSISLPAHPKDDLQWKEQKERASKAIEEGLFVFWELDLGFKGLKNNFNDPAAFLSHSIVLQEFTNAIWKNYSARTLGISLYRGSIDFFSLVHWTSQINEHLTEWLSDHALPSQPHSHFLQVFCANIFGEYLHRLASYLPEDARLFCHFDACNGVSRAQLAHVLAKERFEHFDMVLQGGEIAFGISPSKVGVMLPYNDALSMEILSQLDDLFDQLDHRNIPFRVISETYLTEQWNGLDLLCVLSSSLNPLAKRKLQGFCAAGGTASVIGAPIGLSQEITFQEFMKSSVWSDLV